MAFGERTSLNDLFELIQGRVAQKFPRVRNLKPQYRDFRAGDVRHSLADVSKSKALLDYAPEFSVRDGLYKAANWYMGFLK